ncbi:KilA-N domain-containing protein [Nitrosomonas sp. Nm34]|nr:KilA-N domain-containing protein [Nitrosomonas sp. Nm34]
MTELTVLTTKIRQLNGLYSLNDLHKAAGSEAKHEPNQFMRNAITQELIEEISKSADSRNYVPVKITRGKSGGTYACRELLIAYAAWISAAFHLKVIRVFLEQANPEVIQAEQIAKQVSKHLQRAIPSKYCLLPEHQEKEILDRLHRVWGMFHPFSEQFMDLLGMLRILRGCHPNYDIEEPSYRAVIKQHELDKKSRVGNVG